MTSGKVPPPVPQRLIPSRDAASSAPPAIRAGRNSAPSGRVAADATGVQGQAVVDELNPMVRARSASAPGERPALPPRPAAASSRQPPPIPTGYGSAVAPRDGARRPPPIPPGYGPAAQEGLRRAPPPPPSGLGPGGIPSDPSRRPPPIIAPLPGLPTADGKPAGPSAFAIMHALLTPGAPPVALEMIFPPPREAISTASPASSDASTSSARSDASTPSATLPGLPRSQSASSVASTQRSPSWLDRALGRTRVSLPTTVTGVVQQAGNTFTPGMTRVAADAELAQLESTHRETAERIKNYATDLSGAIDEFRKHANLTATGLFRLTAQHPEDTESHKLAHDILKVTRSTAMFSDEMRVDIEAQQSQTEEFAAPLIQRLRPDKRESFEKLLDLCVDLVANHVNTGSFDEVKAKRDALTATSRYFPRLAPERAYDLPGDARFLSGKFAQFMQAAILLRARARNPELHALLTGAAPQ